MKTPNLRDLVIAGNHLRQKIKMWARLQHEHVLPLLGLFWGHEPLPGLVSPWMSNGNLIKFLDKHRNVFTQYERFRLVSFKFSWWIRCLILRFRYSWKILPRRCNIVGLLLYMKVGVLKGIFS